MVGGKISCPGRSGFNMVALKIQVRRAVVRFLTESAGEFSASGGVIELI